MFFRPAKVVIPADLPHINIKKIDQEWMYRHGIGTGVSKSYTLPELFGAMSYFVNKNI